MNRNRLLTLLLFCQFCYSQSSILTDVGVKKHRSTNEIIFWIVIVFLVFIFYLVYSNKKEK